MNTFRQRKAFTIVEMVIVIAVIAILATVLVPTISGVIQRANVAADQQFAASLNIQLAMYSVDKPIESESNLREAINSFYGKFNDDGTLAADGDFYATLAPKSGNQGYHYWWNATDNQVVLAKYEDLLPDPSEPAAAEAGTLSFSPASLRSLLIQTEEGEKNFFLMDQAGSNVVDLVVAFENLGDDGMVGSGSSEPEQQYEYAVNTLKDSAVAGSLEAALLAKVQVTTIITDDGAFRFNDVANIKHVYVPLSTTIINVQKIYAYKDDGTVDAGTKPSATNPLADASNVKVVQIPVGVKIASNGFPAMAAVSKVEDLSDPTKYQDATVLEFLTNDMADLTDAEGNFMFDLQTSMPVFKLLGSGLYVMIEDEVFSLPYNEGDDSVEIGGTVGTGTSENLNVEVSFPNASANPGEGTHYFDGSTLYVQYDLTELLITVTNGKHVIWEYTEVKAEGEEPDSVRISIDKVNNKLKINSKIELNDNNQIRVTGKINGVEKVSFVVCLVMPREVQVDSYNSTDNAYGDDLADAIVLEYDTTDTFSFDFDVNYSAIGKVAPWDITVDSLKGNFTAALNDAKDTVTITLIEHEFSDDALVVTVGDETFEIKVKAEDKSGALFTKAPVRENSTVLVGDNYLFRVGNANENLITLGRLFTTQQAYSEVAFKLYDYSYTGKPVIGKGSQVVTVGGATEKQVKENETDATYVDRYWIVGRDNWDDVTLRFHNTGVVKIEIGHMVDGVFDHDTFVLLEVVEGTNISTDDYDQMKSATNPVLWHDVTMPTGNYQYTLNNATLYGNGYKFDVSGGRTKGTVVSENYLVGLNSGTLDNVELIGAVYDQFGGTASKDKNNALVHVTGDSYIYNSYLANCMSPVRVRGNVTIVDTTVQGGSFANMEVREGTVTFEGDIVTINQADLNAQSGINKVGLGIVVYYEGVPETTKIIVKGTMTQYNFLSENDKSKLGSPSGSILDGVIDYTEALLDEMLNQTDYVFKIDNVKWVHTGIISMMSTFDGDNLEGSLSGYKGPTPVSASDQTGTAWAIPSQNGASAMSQMLANYSTWQPSGQGVARPKVTQDTTSWTSPQNGNDWKKWQNGQVDISMDQGDSTTWNPNILTIKKGDKTLVVDTIKVKGYDTNYKGQSITFGKSGFGAGEYVVVYTYTDSHNYNNDGTAKSITYEHTVKIKVSEVAATAKNAVFELAPGKGYPTKTVTSGTTTYLVLDIPASEVGSAVSGYTQVFTTTKGVNVAKQPIGDTTYYVPARAIDMSDGKTNHTSGWYAYFSIFDGVIQITDYADQGTGAEIIYNDASSSVPSGLSVDGDPTSLFKYSSASSAGDSPVKKNNKWVYSSAKIEADRTVIQTPITYIYTDNKGATVNYQVLYYAPAQTYTNTCVTPDTLVTLADGSKKMIKDVTKNDYLLAWNFITGQYEAAPIISIVNHGKGTYEVLTLYFDDGTNLNVIANHGVYDEDIKEFAFISTENVNNYLGHTFIKDNGGELGYTKLIDYSIEIRETESYSIASTFFVNCFLEGLFTQTPPEVGNGNFYMPFEIGDNMKFDEEKMAADVEKYGLFTYEDFAGYMPKEMFDAVYTIPYIKVSVGKGLVTLEEYISIFEKYVFG